MLTCPVSFDNTMRELFEYPDPSFPFVVWTGDFQNFVDRGIVCHWHNEFEYGVLLSGELDYFIDGQHIRLKQGDAVFVNADTMHMATQAGEQKCAVMFTVSFLPSLFSGGNDGAMFRKFFMPLLQSSIKGFAIEHTASEGKNIIDLLYEIYSLDAGQSEHTGHYELICLGIISRLWSLTLSYINNHGHEFIQLHNNHRNEDKAKDILTYIHTHYAEDIKINAIAGKTGISRSECFRCFRRYTGKTPIEYLAEYRLAHAVNLLSGTSKTITEIAVECGFSNSSYFGKTFKKKYAVSPLRFKAALSSAEPKTGGFSSDISGL